MSQLQGILATVGWGVGFSVSGLVLGVAIDGIFGHRLAESHIHPLIRGVAQLAAGIAILSELIAVVIPAETVAPLSDGILFYWFFEAQPRMRHNLSDACERISRQLFPPKMDKLVPSTPASNPPAPAPAPTPECDKAALGAPLPPHPAAVAHDHYHGLKAISLK